MAGSTPTARDSVLDEATRLAVDLAEMLLEYRDVVGAEDALRLSDASLELPGECRRARDSLTGDKSREHLGRAGRVAAAVCGTLTALAEKRRVPLLAAYALHRRLKNLAAALEALATPAQGPAPASSAA
jgi:hypothetical protein